VAKAVVLGTPAHGHVNPTLALVAELVRRGEQVIYITTEEFRSKVEHVGAEYRSHPEFPDVDRSIYENVFSLAELAMRLTLQFMPRLIDEVTREKPDYVLHDALAMAGKLISQRLGIPAVSMFPYFAVLPHKGTGSWRYNLEVLQMLFGKFPSALRGLQHVWQLRRLHGRKTGLVDIFTNVEQINLVFTSRDFQPHGKSFDDRFRFVGPQLAFRPQSSDFPFDRLEGKSVIYISLGTLFNEEPDFYVMCFEAFGGVDHQVVMSVGTKTEIGSLGPIPANFIVRNQVPQLQILEQADLFVGHGGFNSVSEGLYYGVPLVAVPQGGDQVLTAFRLKQLGAGIYIHPNKVTPKRLREAALRALDDPSMRRNSETIGRSLRAAGGHTRAADEVLRYVHRPIP